MAFPFDSLLPWLDLAGLSVFAASGALAAVRQRLDFVGACFFALCSRNVQVPAFAFSGMPHSVRSASVALR